MRSRITSARRIRKLGVRLSRNLTVFVLAILTLNRPQLGSAAETFGSLDSTFGNGGKVTTNFRVSEEAQAVAIQADGKIVAAGEANELAPSTFALVRYNADGSLDTSFGAGGRVTTGFDLGSGASDLAIQSDGKIVAAGTGFSNSSHSLDFAVVRYNIDGSLDSTFGSGGKVTTDFFGAPDFATAVVIQADGKIVLGGHAFNPGPPQIDWALVRYNPDGSVDSSFGNGGKVTTDFLGNTDFIGDLVAQPDGKLVAAGSATVTSTGYSLLAVARYNVNGSLDSTFGSGGKLTTSFGFSSSATGAGLQADGKIVVVGTADDLVAGGQFALLRYNADGTLDPVFGTGGKVATSFSAFGGTAGRALAIYPNGKIIVGGVCLQPGFPRNQDFALARYNTDGSLDTGFGSNGKVTTDFSGGNDEDSLNDLAIQPDGKIVAVGSSSITNSDFAVARYNLIIPRIQSASIDGKKLSVLGEGFDDGALIFINGEKQKTTNDAANPKGLLFAKKGGKKIMPGDTVILQVRNPDEELSLEFRFSRPTG